MRSEPTITTFKELFDEINYSWENGYDLNYHESDDSFSLNKLYITKDEVSYKMDRWKLAPGLFEKVKVLHGLLYPPANSVDFMEKSDELEV